MSACLLVTGTDTGVGKTLVTAALAAALSARGVRLAVAKPAETGCALVDDALEPADARVLAAAARSTAPLTEVCPYRFAEPLAPALAAERAGTRIDVPHLVAMLRRRATAADVVLVEGAGGLLAPLTPAATYADLAGELEAAVLLVVGSRLGAINHTRLTLEVLAARGLAVRGYVLNRLVAGPDLAADTNRALLAALTPVPCLGEVPWIPDADRLLTAVRARGREGAAAHAALAAIAATHLDLAALLPPA